MFGLMRAKKCGMSAEERNFRRLNYCGTCKTIGSLYGQKSRLLLNHDTVFLAELLTALSGENVETRARSYQSFNCLNLPENEMPAALQYAATTNVVLAKFKLADHVSDEGKTRHKIAAKTFADDFAKAEDLLQKWNFPLEKVRRILNSQNERELRTEGENPAERLENLALPTAETTAISFAQGANQISRTELAGALSKLGFKFGKLVYLLDALEDYKKDFHDRQFNAIRAAYRLEEKALPSAVERKIKAFLHEIEVEIRGEIYRLPLTERQKDIFSGRLSQNLQRKVQTSLPILPEKQLRGLKRKETFAERWEKAIATARKLARGFSWQMPLVFVFVLFFALVAPAQTRDAKSARECFDLSFNLMFLGAFIGSVMAFPASLMQKKIPVEKLAEEARKKERESWCDWCDEDCFCCCDCDCCDGNCCDGCCCDGCCDCSCD